MRESNRESLKKTLDEIFQKATEGLMTTPIPISALRQGISRRRLTTTATLLRKRKNEK